MIDIYIIIYIYNYRYIYIPVCVTVCVIYVYCPAFPMLHAAVWKLIRAATAQANLTLIKTIAAVWVQGDITNTKGEMTSKHGDVRRFGYKNL